MSTISHKTCTRCGRLKPIDEFYRRSKTRLHSECKNCISVRTLDALVALPQVERDRVKDRQRERNLAQYGIDSSDYEALFEIQGGRCGVCGRNSKRRLHVDHDHVTGKVRGLLCSACNQALGYFGDNPDVLRQAAAYLERHNGRQPRKPLR